MRYPLATAGFSGRLIVPAPRAEPLGHRRGILLSAVQTAFHYGQSLAEQLRQNLLFLAGLAKVAFG